MECLLHLSHMGHLLSRLLSPQPWQDCLQISREWGQILVHYTQAIARLRTTRHKGWWSAAHSTGTSQTLVPGITTIRLLACYQCGKCPCDMSEPKPSRLLQPGLGSNAAASQRLPSSSLLLLPLLMLPVWEMTIRGGKQVLPLPWAKWDSLRFCCTWPAPIMVLQLERPSGQDAQDRCEFPTLQGMPETLLQKGQ